MALSDDGYVGEAASGIGQRRVINVAIIAQRDEARSQDYKHSRVAANLFGLSFSGRFGQKIDQAKPAL
jgi:hypothetical protein